MSLMTRTLSCWAALIIIAVFTSAQAGVPRDPYNYFFNETLGDFPEELEVAREENKKAILIFFEMEACPFCHRMKETVLNQPEVQDYFRQHFMIYSVNIEGNTEIVGFDGQRMTAKDFSFKVNRVRATPVFVFFDLAGKQIVRFTGPTSGIEEFMWLGEFVEKGLYKEMNFTKYKRERKQSQHR